MQNSFQFDDIFYSQLFFLQNSNFTCFWDFFLLIFANSSQTLYLPYRLYDRIEAKLESFSPTDRRVQILENKQRKMMYSGLQTTKAETQKLVSYFQTLIRIVSRQKSTAINCLEMMKDSQLGFNNMNTASQKEMVDLSREIHRIIKAINNKLKKIKHKSKDLSSPSLSDS